MDCPICLDPLNNTLVFSCGHACCQPCYELSGITTCPICRGEITSTTPAPWLNCKSNDCSNDCSNDIPRDFESFEQNDIKPKEIIDPRGYELKETAGIIAGMVRPVATEVDAIMDTKYRKAKVIDDEYNKGVQQLICARLTKLAVLEAESQKLLEADASKVKTQEYYNQGLEHLAQTCLSLSTQTTQVLDQALPIYKDKLDDILFQWPFDISPMQPKGHLPSSRGYYVYVEKLNDFIHIVGNVINCGNESVLVAELIKVKSYGGLIYALNTTRINVYDHMLNLVSVYHFNDKVYDFYVHQGKVGLISDEKVWRPMDERTLGTTFMNKKFVFPMTLPITTEVAGDTLYVRSHYESNTCTVVDDAPVITNSELDPCNQHGMFVSNDMLYTYTSDSKATTLPKTNSNLVHSEEIETSSMLRKKVLPPYVKFYPGARNTVLCVKDKDATLLKLDV